MVITGTLCAGAFALALERLFPAHARPRRSLWWPRAIGFNLLQGATALLGAATWDQLLPALRLSEVGAATGTVAGAAIGYVLITFVYYWWHRARHASPLLWRWLHQLHHSPARLETITSFYKHPLELLANGLLSSFLLVSLLGLDPAQTALAVLLTAFAELFYHCNVRTPHWLGYLIQRPEMHRVHHERGRHHSNYADLPLWDLLFGTFDNPVRGPEACGFEAADELRVGAMLRGRDLTRNGEHDHA